MSFGNDFDGNDEERRSFFNKKDSENSTTSAYVGASWAAAAVGIIAYMVGLWNATMQLNEKGYYFTVLVFGLFAAISLQKTVRDRSDGIPITNIYYGLSWLALVIAILLLTVGLWNAGSIIRSEKGFYAMSFVLSLFASVSIQKNIRDNQ